MESIANMRRWLTLMLLAFVLPVTVSSHDNDLEYYRMKVRDLQLDITSYSAKPELSDKKARQLMLQLKAHKYEILYFSVWDMYIQQLYLTGHQLKAQEELRKMLDEVKHTDNPEVETHVYIAQGMLQQHFGNYIEAENTLRNGLKICPPPSECRYPRNSLSLYRWLIELYIRNRTNYKAALGLCQKQEEVFGEIVKRGLEDQLNRDRVTVLSQKASVLIGLENTTQAKRLIDRCAKMINPHVPQVLYQPYYEALMAYYEATAEYDKALFLCGKMIQCFSQGYKPILRRYMLAKAKLLMKAGRKEEAAEEYDQLERFDDAFDRVRVTNDIKEMEVQYHVHQLEMQNEHYHYYMLLLVVGIVILVIAVCVTIWSYLCTKKRNLILVGRLEDLHIFQRIPVKTEPKGGTSSNRDIVEKFKDYVGTEEFLRNDESSVLQIATTLGTNVSVLNKSLCAETGLSPHEFIVKIRLEAARVQLISKMDEPITNIAFACGYNTVRTFGRQFSAAYGMSPSAYREAFIEQGRHHG